MFKALLTLIVMAGLNPAQAKDVIEDDATQIRPSIVEVGEWSGTYSIKYFPPVNNGTDFSYSVDVGGEYTWQAEIPMEINFNNSPDDVLNSGGELLTYQFNRALLNPTAETDYKHCTGLPAGTKYKTIPRKVVLVGESLANIEAAKADGKITPKQAADKEAGIKGLVAKVTAGVNAPFNGKAQVDHDIVAVIFGKKCGQGDAGKRITDLEDLTIPVIKVDVFKNGSTGEITKLEMTAVLEPEFYQGTLLQGFSFYKMEPSK